MTLFTLPILLRSRSPFTVGRQACEMLTVNGKQSTVNYLFG
jgi:hypothetical protein